MLDGGRSYCAGGSEGARLAVAADAHLPACSSPADAACAFMVVVQDAYVQYLAQDGDGAISAFLNDGSITTLQVSACSMLHTNLPAVCQAHMHGHANASAWVLTGDVASWAICRLVCLGLAQGSCSCSCPTNWAFRPGANTR